MMCPPSHPPTEFPRDLLSANASTVDRLTSPSSLSPSSSSPVNPPTLNDDTSWSLVSTPSLTPCLTSTGSSHLSAFAIEEFNGEAEDDDVIIASYTVEEPEAQQSLDDPCGTTDSGEVLSHTLTRSLTPKTPTRSPTTNPYSSSVLLRQRLLGNNSSTIKSLSRFAGASIKQNANPAPPVDLSFCEQAFHLSSIHRPSSHSVSVVGRSEDAGVTESKTFQRADQFTQVRQLTPTAQSIQQTTTTSTQFVSCSQRSPAPFTFPPSSSSPARQSIRQENPRGGYHYSAQPPHILMQPNGGQFMKTHRQHQLPQEALPATHSVGPIQQPLRSVTSVVPVFQSTLLGSFNQGSRSQREAVTGNQVARTDNTAGPNQRDYAVASAAYSKAMSDAARIQMMTAAQFANSRPSHHQPIIIQNTTKAVAESQNESKTTMPPPKRSVFETWMEFIQNFWSSKLNRFLLLGFTGASLYLYWEWWQHQKRMQLMQRRIEANPLLRLGKMISGVTDGQRSRHYNSGTSYY